MAERNGTVGPDPANWFLAENYDRLVDSPIEIGKFRQADFEQGGAKYSVVVDADPEDYDLAAEVQNCAIELLALLKEDELPDLEISNREVLAWDLAHAEYDFIIDLLRLTGRIPDWYSRNAPESGNRFTEFRLRD